MRNTLILFFCLLLVPNRIRSQTFDTIDVYSVIETQDFFPPMKFYYDYVKQHIYKTGLSTYKLKFYFRDSLTGPTVPGSFPADVSFIIDTNKVVMFFDSSPLQKHTIFNFNVVPGDTLSVVGNLLGHHYGYISTNLESIKIVIDTITSISFGKFGNKQVYHYHQIYPVGMGLYLNSYWIKGLINGTGGVLNEYVNTEPGPIQYYTTCFTYKDTCTVLIPAYLYNYLIPECTSFIMNTPDDYERNFSLTCFPNPATKTFTIETDFEKPEKILIKLTNILGEVMQIIDNANVLGSYKKTVNIDHLPQGLYMLSLQYGNKLYTKKIVKSNW
ncbi:MAG: T9SS type A sorting domain-containing protein [Bacteroidia bacterium]|nr:T9SS type A sorting domain-containing protein [Bacteroidia bacterium]